eukprot:1191183-Prorocentrum_minimum.AAC.3
MDHADSLWINKLSFLKVHSPPPSPSPSPPPFTSPLYITPGICILASAPQGERIEFFSGEMAHQGLNGCVRVR